MKLKSLLLLIIFPAAVFSQSAVTLQQAIKLKNEYRFEESLAAFRMLLKGDSSNVEYLQNTSFLLSKVGNRKKEESERQNYFQLASYLAQKAIATDPKSADAHYTYSLALARINEYAGNKQKIANAKLIKNACDQALKINPKHAAALHILGHWHRTIAGFNFMEKAMINSFFGGVPVGGSYKDAISCFSHAVLLEPAVILHQYELAVTYNERDEEGDDVLCKIWCKKAMALTPRHEDDRITQAKAAKLLEKVK